jgi:hypothetical protein
MTFYRGQVVRGITTTPLQVELLLIDCRAYCPQVVDFVAQSGPTLKYGSCSFPASRFPMWVALMGEGWGVFRGRGGSAAQGRSRQFPWPGTLFPWLLQYHSGGAFRTA